MTDAVSSVRTLDSWSGGCRLVWSRLVDLGSIDPGSNPGSPTILWVQNRYCACFRFLNEVKELCFFVFGKGVLSFFSMASFKLWLVHVWD